MRKIPLKTDRITIKARFLDELKQDNLTGVETNSNYVEFYYWIKFNNLKVTVDGVEYGLHNLGKLSKILDSGETCRTEWSKIRSEMKLKLELEKEQEFKQEYSKKG